MVSGPFILDEEDTFSSTTLAQAEVDSVDWAALAGIGVLDGVVSGCEVSQDTGSNEQVSVASGVIRIGGVLVNVTGASFACTTSNASNPFFDLVEVNASGTVTANNNGTVAAQPQFPARTASTVWLAAVFRPAGTTVSVIDAHIVDKRQSVALQGEWTGDMDAAGNDLTMNGGALIGDLTGNADTATEIEQINATTNATASVVLVDNTLGAQGLKHDAGLTYDATANDLTVGNDLNLGGDLLGNGAGMTIAGGDGDNEYLTIKSNSNNVEDAVRMEAGLRFYESDPTFDDLGLGLTGDSTMAMFCVFDGNITVDTTGGFLDAGAAIQAIRMGGTITLDRSGNIYGLGVLFNHITTYKNKSTEANNFGPVYSFVDQPTLQADSQSVTGSHRGYVTQPSFEATGTSPTLTVSETIGVDCAVGVDTNVTLTDRVGLRVKVATASNFLSPPSGTITNEAGVMIANLTQATNSTQVLLGRTTIPSGDWAIYSDSTAVSHFDGRIELDTTADLTIIERSTTPTAPTAADRARIYMRGDKLIVQGWTSTDGDSYWYLDMSNATGRANQQWTYSASAPT